MTNDNKNNPKPGNPEGRNKPGGGRPSFSFYWIYAIIAMILISMMVLNTGRDGARISYDQFRNLAQRGYIEQLVRDENRAKIYFFKDRMPQATQDSLNISLSTRAARSPPSPNPAGLTFPKEKTTSRK